MKCVGIHVFAGGFTMGVKDFVHARCDTQLEKHDLGAETAKQFAGVDVIRGHWPDLKGELAFGNPRCTAFSSLTGGYSDRAHGPTGDACIDAIQFCEYSAGKFDFCVWESVQQAYTVGKSLLDELYETHFKPKHYRLCHVFINAATFGNSQIRRRYFFVAYRDCYKFNLKLPTVKSLHPMPTVGEVLSEYRKLAYLPDSDEKIGVKDRCTSLYATSKLTEDEQEVIPRLPQGWSLNRLAREKLDDCTQKQMQTWQNRKSDKPFSLHCVRRLDPDDICPTIHSGASKWIHPVEDRTLRMGELAYLMGWPLDAFPIGTQAVYQIAKGIVPDVGTAIARSVHASLNNEFDEDYGLVYDRKVKSWGGFDATGLDVKTIDATEYFKHAQ